MPVDKWQRAHAHVLPYYLAHNEHTQAGQGKITGFSVFLGDFVDFARTDLKLPSLGGRVYYVRDNTVSLPGIYYWS